MMQRQTLLKIALILILTSLAVATAAAQALAQDGASVYLQPVDSSETALTVDVIAENVTELYGAEFRLKFDPALLAAQDANPNQDGLQIEAGTLLPADKGFVVANQVNNAEGTITFALTLLNPAPPVSGSGPLARIAFTKLQNAPSTINIEKAKLVAINLQTIPSQTIPFTIDANPQQSQPALAGDASNRADAAPAANSGPNFPWWIVAAAIIILGIIGLVALVAFSGLNKSQNNKIQPTKTRPQTQPAQPATPQPAQPRPRHVSGTRPSAFK